MARLRNLALSRGTVDRAATRRHDGSWVDALWADSRTRVVPVIDGQVPVVDEPARIAFATPSRLPEIDECYFLGQDSDEVAYFAARVTGTDEGRLAGLRELGALLSDLEAGLLVHAVALDNWHARHRYCPQCGDPTKASVAGDLRSCTMCGAEHFPRNDPAIIVLVTDERDRCLLGRQTRWPAGRFSTLAGFVEPGESLEHAVIREVAEESGIQVADPVYAGSQPWPFPSSLMLGFYARAATTGIAVDGDEIAEARWFSRAELRTAVDEAVVLLPARSSIARRLIEGWYGDELPGDG